jgi:hypothetical protein
MNLMHGPQFAKSYVNEYLKTDIPSRIVSYRNGWNVDDITLPDPVDYFIHEPLAMDNWPTLITVAISTNRLNRIGHDGSDPLYRVDYSMRTYVWVRAGGAEEATIMRDRLTTVIRSALLDKPCLNAYDARNSFQAMIDESTMREEFSDLTLLKGDRFLAGSYVAYTMQIDEIVSREAIGEVAEFDLEARQTPIGEDLPTFIEDEV